MPESINYRFVCRRDTAANWVIHGDDVLYEGEWGIETDTQRGKLGDGQTPYRALRYASPGEIDFEGLIEGSFLTWDAARFCWRAMNTDLTIASIGAVFDGGGANITAGAEFVIFVPYAFDILEWRVMCPTAADAFIADVQITPYAAFPPDVGDSVTAAAPPKIAVAGTTKNNDIALTGWTKSFVSGQVVRFVVTSSANCAYAVVQLTVRKK